MSKRRNLGNDNADESASTAMLDTPEAGPDASVAEVVGKKSYTPAPDPFQFAHDNLAGVRLLESRKYREMQIAFDEKPSPQVIDKAKECGFRWNNQEKLWALKLNPSTANRDRVEGQRAYREIADMIRAERGHEPTTGIGR
jgi:hypothetical protein